MLLRSLLRSPGGLCADAYLFKPMTAGARNRQVDRAAAGGLWPLYILRRRRRCPNVYTVSRTMLNLVSCQAMVYFSFKAMSALAPRCVHCPSIVLVEAMWHSPYV